MRRTLQEVKEADFIETVLQRAQVCRLGFSVDDRPYIVPVNFGYTAGRLFIHGASEGRKMDMLRANPRVCFEVELEEELGLAQKGESPCTWGFRYISIIGFGEACQLEDEDEKRRALDVIVEHYGGKPIDYPPSSMHNLAVIEIRVESMTCKRNS